jgi:transcriptional regulator with XRE-family HTH domain
MDVKTFLSEELKRRQKFNKSYSLRAFARDLNLEVSIISKIISGHRGAGKKVCQQLEDIFKIPFIPTQGLRKKRTDSNAETLDEHLHFNVISQWEYMAVLNLCECSNFQSTVSATAKHLAISHERAQEVVDELFFLHFLEEQNGRWVRTVKQLNTTHGVRSLALRTGNREFLQLAAEKLNTASLEERDFSSLVLAIDENYLPLAKNILNKFRKDFLMIFSELPKEKNRVFQLNLQFFPLSNNVTTEVTQNYTNDQNH